nr:cysteine-rich small domain-containing protein [Methanosarcina horonobensis]
MGGRKTCEYYPCHFEGQNCTFCFCPFYPCENEKNRRKMDPELKRRQGMELCRLPPCP